MADPGRPQGAGEWQDIVGRRVLAETGGRSVPPPARSVRLSELEPPPGKAAKKADPSPGTGETPSELLARLRESEEARREALERIAQLEAELAQLRSKLEEAYGIIKAIEEAYIAGEGGEAGRRP